MPGQPVPKQVKTLSLGLGPFLCGFVPGLLQYQLGLKVRAATAFVSCAALYFAGWPLVRDRLFYFALVSPEDLGERATGMFPWVLPGLARIGLPITLPEVLNLPANAIGSILSFSTDFEAQRLWRLPRPGEDLGGFLTAASGLLAAFWAADGLFQMRLQRDGNDQTPRSACSPGLAAGLSWLLPGVGHALNGQRGKGLLMGLAVAIVFAAGMLFGQGHSVDRAIASVWWIGQSLFGGGALFASLVTAPIPMTAFPENLELGTNLCTVAGLMNLVVMCDAFTVAERHSFPLRAAVAK